MKFDTFKKQILILSCVFPNRKIDPEIYFEFWKDLDDEVFERAVDKFIRKTPTLFPDTNIIAEIIAGCKNKNHFDTWEKP